MRYFILLLLFVIRFEDIRAYCVRLGLGGGKNNPPYREIPRFSETLGTSVAIRMMDYSIALLILSSACVVHSVSE